MLASGARCAEIHQLQKWLNTGAQRVLASEGLILPLSWVLLSSLLATFLVGSLVMATSTVTRKHLHRTTNTIQRMFFNYYFSENLNIWYP